MWTLTLEVGSQKYSGHSMNLGALRSKIRCETNSRRIVYGNLLGGKDPNSGLISGLSTMTVPQRVRAFLAKKSITKMNHPPYSPDLTLAIFGSFRN
jgi:hypothetical protein